MLRLSGPWFSHRAENRPLSRSCSVAPRCRGAVVRCLLTRKDRAMSSRRALATIGFVFLVLLTSSRFAGAQTCVTDGTALRTGSTANGLPQLVADGAGGSFVAWADSRNGNYDIFVARVSSSGSISWGPTNICSATGDQKNPHVAADGSGGFFVAWEDGRTTANGKDVYAQRVTSTGRVRAGRTCGSGHHRPPSGMTPSRRVDSGVRRALLSTGLFRCARPPS